MRRWIGLALACLVLAPVAAAQPPTPNRGTWTCALDNIGNTLTECEAAAPAGLRYYLTDVVAQSTTGTAGQFLIRTGTGTNCATGTASLFPDAATAVRLAHPANTVPPTVITLSVGIPAPVASAICVLGVATNTVTIILSGYINP